MKGAEREEGASFLVSFRPHLCVSSISTGNARGTWPTPEWGSLPWVASGQASQKNGAFVLPEERINAQNLNER
jgi:hypothetical protein